MRAPEMRLGQAAHHIWACAAALWHRGAARPAGTVLKVKRRAASGACRVIIMTS